MRTTAAVLLLATACGHAPAAKPPATTGLDVTRWPRPTAPTASGAATRLGWLAGRWHNGTMTEHWVALGHAMIGVDLGADRYFDVFYVVADPGADAAAVRMVTFPAGAKRSEFVGTGGAELRVGDATNPFPKIITYQRSGADLAVALTGELPDVSDSEPAPSPETTMATRLTPRDADDAPAIADAERAFAAATAAGGAAACAAWFAPDGGAWGDGPASAADACGYLAPADGSYLVDWWPVHTGLSPDAQLGYSIGRWRTLGPAGPAGPTGTFVTIWAKQPDGSWKVRFDTGVPDPVTAPAA